MLKATLDAVSRLDLSEFRMHPRRQQHARSGDVAAGRGALPRARRALQLRQCAKARRLQGGRLAARAGATAADAEIIGIIDSDYAVPRTGSPTSCRSSPIRRSVWCRRRRIIATATSSPLHHAMNGEYAGFFDIGMVERNEVNAIIVHGTMCLIRRAALERRRRLVERHHLRGHRSRLTMLEQGWVAHYTNRRYGYGLLPDTFEAYKKQRDRWASGGFQIVRKHWRAFLPGASLLTPRAEARIRLRLAQLAGRRDGRRVGGDPQSHLGAGRRVRRHRRARQGADFADSCDLRGFGRAFHRALSAVGCRSRSARRPAPWWPPWRCNGRWRARSRMASSRTTSPSCVPPRAAARPAGPAGQPSRRSTKPIIGGLLLFGALLIFETNHERVREIGLFALVLLVQSIPFVAAAGARRVREFPGQ